MTGPQPGCPTVWDVDETHDPALTSWVESANDSNCDFPLQNLPFGRFRSPEDSRWRPGVAIGDQVLDLWKARFVVGEGLSELMAASLVDRRTLRRALSRGLRAGSADQARLSQCLVAQAVAELTTPCEIGDYTDFYVGIHHARAVGRLLRPDNPLLPNYRWVPIGYHGRASTVFASGHTFPRPHGQVNGADDVAPRLAPTQRLDYELELGAFIGRPNAPGQPISLDAAESHLFGLVLLNDWSARDVQAWEYVPLGPFLAKNFATTISPWVVTMEALAPFRRPFVRQAGEPESLPYLSSGANSAQGAIDIDLDIFLQTAQMREQGSRGEPLARSGFVRAAYWTLAQMVTHHSVNGCALRTGDLLGTGTLSGPNPAEAGSLLELTRGGKDPIVLSNGERRTFVEDGDAVVIRGCCSRDQFRAIGFGECRATVGGT
jgi:fumarylacetoacetase